MTRPRLIIGVTGYAQHGKDTIGTRLVYRWAYRKMGFADGLRSMALAVDPLIPLEPRQTGHAKLSPLVARLSLLVKAIGWDRAKKYTEVRRFLQALGTEGVRDHIGEDAWVDALERRWRAEDRPNIVITDVRFPNEAAWVHRTGGILLRVTRPGFDNGVPTDHPSEAHIASLPADYEVCNDGPIGLLFARVDRIVEAQ